MSMVISSRLPINLLRGNRLFLRNWPYHSVCAASQTQAAPALVPKSVERTSSAEPSKHLIHQAEDDISSRVQDFSGPKRANFLA